MESEKQVLNDALDQLITEAGHMLQDFKQHIAFENENTLKKSDSDAKHLKAYTSLLAQWSQIKNLYMLILSTQDKESVEKIAPIEVILQKISSPEVKFKNHEFQFPFNVTTLISFVKGIVKASQRPEKKSTKKLSEDTIDTNNVREAAKKFQELTERVAETVTLSKKKTVKSFDQKVKNRNLLKAPLKMRSATVRVPSSRTTGDIDKSSLEQPKSPVDETMAYLYGNETESPKTIVIEETKFDRLGRPRPPVPVKPQFEELAAKLKNTSLSRSATMKGADRAASGSKDIESHSRASSGAVRADSAPPDFENSASKEVSSALADKTLSRTASGQIPTNSDLKASDNLVKPTLNHASSIARLHPDISSSQDNINSAFGLVKSASSGIMKKMETIQNHGHSPSSPPRELKSGKGASSLSVSNLANIYQTASPTLNKNELGRSGSMKIKSSVRDQIAAIQNHGSKDIGSLANLKVSAELSRNNEVSPKKSQNDGSEVANKELEVEKKEIINAPINLVAAEENIEVHSAPAPETPLVARLEVDPVSRPLSIQGERKTSIKVNPHSDSEPVRKLSAKPDDAPKENDTEPVKPQVETAKDANEEITTDQDKFLSATSLELCQSRKASIKIDGRLSGNEPRKMSLKECMPPTLSRKASIKPSVEDIQEAVKAVEFKVASEIIEITKEIETGDQNFVAEGTIPGSPSRKMSSCSTSTIDPKQAGNTKSLSTSGNDLTIERNSADTANTNGDAFYFARTMVPGDETANLLRDGNLNGSNTNPAIVIDDAESPERLFVPTRTPVMEDEVDNPFRSSRKNRKSFEVEPSLPAKTKVIVKRTPIDENEKENPLRGKLSFRKENKDDSETEIVEEKRASKSFAEDRVAPATQSEIGQSLPLNLISTAPVPEVSQDVDQIELSAALNGMAVPMKYGMGNSEFSAATVVKAKRETINDMTEDQIAELEIEMESSQPSEADADEFLATTTSNRRISLPMTSVFETTENDPLLSLQTNSMFGSFHGESKLDLDAESIGGEDAEEDSILANEDDFPLDSSPKLEDDTVAATDANEGAAKMKAHRVVGLQKLKNTKSDLASKQQESPMNALYAAVYTANSTKAPPPPVVNRSAKPRSSSKSTPNAYEQPLRSDSETSTSKKRADITSMMFNDKDYIVGIMNAFDEQEKLLEELDDTDLADEMSISSQNPPKSGIQTIAQPTPLPKVKEEYDMRKEIPPMKDDFGTEFNDLFNSLNSKYEISSTAASATKTPPKKPQSATKPKSSHSGQGSMTSEISAEILEAIAQKTDENSSLVTIKPPQKLPAPPPNSSNRKSLRPNLRVDPTTKGERPLSKIIDKSPMSGGPKYLERPVSKLMKSPHPEEATITLATKSQPFDPVKAERVISEDDPEEEDRNISVHRLHQFNTPFKNYNVLLVPLNAMFDMRAIEMTISHRFGRNNTTNHPAFKGFGTLVVSRNHVDMFERDGKDIGSNSGTFRNNARLSPPGQPSPEVELHTGDYIQLGKDFQDDSPLDEFGRIPARRRCVRFQVVIIAPCQNAASAIRLQQIPIEKPVNRSDSMPVLENDTAAVPMAKEFSAENKEPVVPGPEDNKDTKDTKDTKEIKENKDNKETSSKESLLSGDKKVLASSLTTIGILSPLPNPPPSLAKVSNNVNNELLKGNSSNIKEILKAQANLEHFIISYIVVGGKVTKLQVCGASNVTLMEVNLKKWEERARFTVVDFRMGVGHGFDIFLENKPGAKSPAKLKNFSDNVPWHVVLSDGTHVGQLVYTNGIKLELTPTDKPADGAMVAISGDFKEQREQQRFGECKGKHLVKKTFLDSTWNCNFEMHDSKNNRLVLCGAILSCILNP